MKKVALSSCLLGCRCRYDANDNLNEQLLELLSDYEIVPFCPEDYCFGTPRATMDLVKEEGIVARSNENQNNLTADIRAYAEDFFLNNPEIELVIGKDRSPSCGVKSAKVYDREKNLLHTDGTGIMIEEALALGIPCWDAEIYVATHIA